MDASETVLQSALERIAAVEQELLRLLGKEFPGTAAPGVLRSLCDLLTSMRANVTEAWKLALQDGVDPALETLGLTGPLIFVHHILQYFDHSDSSRVPFELVSAFETLARDLSGAATSFVFRPSRSFTYEIINLEQLFKESGDDGAAVASSARGVQIVLFPAAEAGSSLIHTILFHEIGHACYSKYMDVTSAHSAFAAIAQTFEEPPATGSPEEQAADPGATSDAAPTRETAVPAEASAVPATETTAVPADDPIAEDSDADMSGGVDVLNAWMREIFSDCLALRLVGPAYVCAFRWYTVPVAAPAEGEMSHPSPELRLEIMNHYLQRLRAKHPALDTLCTLFGEHAAPTPFVPLDPTPPDVPETEQDLVAVALRTESFREELFRSFDKTPTVFDDATLADDIKRATDGIAIFIPPGAAAPESLTSLQQMLAVAFNSCWLFRVTQLEQWLGKPPDGFGWESARGVSTLNQLCLASVEGGELLLRYRKAKASA